MAFNVADFQHRALTSGGARSALFEVIFPNVTNLATALPGSGLSSSDRFSFLCSAASIPAFRVDAIPVYYFGRATYETGERSFEPWVITMLNDEDFGLRDFFEAWSNQMNSLVGNVAESSDPQSFKVDQAIVRQYGKDGSVLREYAFYGMWPSIVGEIALSWDQGNRIETFDTRLVYDYFVPVTSASGISDSPNAAPPSYDPGLTSDTNALAARFVTNS